MPEGQPEQMSGKLDKLTDLMEVGFIRVLERLGSLESRVTSLELSQQNELIPAFQLVAEKATGVDGRLEALEERVGELAEGLRSERPERGKLAQLIAPGEPCRALD